MSQMSLIAINLLKTMENINLNNLILLFFFLIFSFFSNAQNKYPESSMDIIHLIDSSENFYSTNDELVNGSKYFLPNSKIHGHPYLKNEWNSTTIFINNTSYKNLSTKYDLTTNDLILKIKTTDSIEQLINLNRFQIDSFRLGESLFINSMHLIHKRNNPIYYELIFKGKFALLIKYDKVFKKSYNNITPHGKFSSIRKDIYFLNNNQLINVNRNSKFIKCFNHDIKDKIKSFMKDNNINYRKASKDELYQLMNYVSTLLKN